MVEEKGSEGKAEEQPAAAAKEALPELFPKETPIVNKGKARKVTGLVELGPALRQEVSWPRVCRCARQLRPCEVYPAVTLLRRYQKSLPGSW